MRRLFAICTPNGRRQCIEINRHLARVNTAKLIVDMAFDRSEDGELLTAFGPADQQSEERAVRLARTSATKHVGVIAWFREAHADIGEYGPPTTLFVKGDVPEME
jgi:hypothetical protein